MLISNTDCLNLTKVGIGKHWQIVPLKFWFLNEGFLYGNAMRNSGSIRQGAVVIMVPIG